MRHRPTSKFRPLVEGVEKRVLLSTAVHTTHVAHLKARSAAMAGQSAETPASPATASGSATKSAAGLAHVDHRRPKSPPSTALGFRITNPTKHAVSLIPPFGHVLVQKLQPVPGQVYNIMYVAVKNGLNQTFTASNGFAVRFPNKKHAKVFPILTGTQQWLPNHWIVFYVLTKQYYPLTQIQGGFQFDLGGRSTTLVPGPSAIYQRIKYNPATFGRRSMESWPSAKVRSSEGDRRQVSPTRRSTKLSPAEPTRLTSADISDRTRRHGCS